MPLRSRLLPVVCAVATAVAVAASSAAVAAPLTAPAPGTAAAVRAAAPDTTGAVEAARVDRVPTPKLRWKPCFDYAECATVQLPLDYDDPAGPSTAIGVLRVKARNQKRRIGSLFVNPGGPGGEGTAIALSAPRFLGDGVLDRFDIVGFDPRGIGRSANVRCFPSVAAQSAATVGMQVRFPYTKAEESAYITSVRAVGKACSTTGTPLSGAMSTAEAARDLDVLRRAVGDAKLSYLGFSYGTVLGQYYANMFPDRVRALTVDGVVNPASWVGDATTQDTIQDERLRSAAGAYGALHEILVRCAKSGAELCPFAADGDPVRNFETVAARLRVKPLVIDGSDGGISLTVSYADFVTSVLGALYSPVGYAQIVANTADLLGLTDPARPAAAARQASARQAIRAWVTTARAADPAYGNAYETYAAVTCTDGRHPRDAALWPKLTADADRRAPYFSRPWDWASAVCARTGWTVRDEDAYEGPFTRRTSAPVLVVGNYWDPATNYDDAVGASRLLPNSRLLSSDSWGHTAYGTSTCVTAAVDAYLLNGTLPPAGRVCTGDVQPFTGQPQDVLGRPSARRVARPAATLAELVAAGPPAASGAKLLPPVVLPPGLAGFGPVG